MTLCSGSRYADGEHVPDALWGVDEFRVSSVAPDDSGVGWRGREAVS
jgi:hypothetical protein